MNDLEKAVLDIIEEVYKKKYIGNIKVTKIADQESYILKLYMGNNEFPPIQLAADGTVEDFLNFVRKELVSRQLIRNKFFKVVKYDDLGGTCRKN
mgnify:CR=1 FL=1